MRTFSSLWGDDEKASPAAEKSLKPTKSFAAWNDSESESDEAPIEIGPRGSKPIKQRTRSSFASEAPQPNSWAAKRQAMLKLKEQESKIEISAEDWNAGEAVQPAPAESTYRSTRTRLGTEASQSATEASSPSSEMAPSPSEGTATGAEPRKVNAGYAKRRTASEPQKQRTRSAVAPTRDKEEQPRTPRRAMTNPAKQPTKRLEAVPFVDGILLDDVAPPPRRAFTNPAKQPTKKVALPARSHSAVSTRPPTRSPGPKARPKAPGPAKGSPKESPKESPRPKESPKESPKDSESPIDADEPLPFFLASCPDRDLPVATDLVKKYGGFYAAGDKDDVFNKDVLVGPDADKEKAESWKVGWKGKVEMCFNMLKQLNPEKEAVFAIAVAGGPACDWERTELRNRFCKVHTDMRLKVCGDIDDLRAWIERQGYREKILNYAQRKAQEQVSHQGRRTKT